MIRMQLWALDTIHYLAYHNAAKCTLLDTPKYSLKYTPDCTWLCTPSLFDLHSQLIFQDFPKYTSEFVLKYTPRHPFKDTPTCSRWHSPSILDCTLPNQLSRSSQAHSWACSQVHSQLHSMTHSQPAWLYIPNWVIKMLPSTLWVRSKSTPPSTYWRTLLSTLSRTIPIEIDCTFLAYLTLRSQVHSRGKTVPISPAYILPWMLLGTRCGDLLRDRCQAPEGGLQVGSRGWQIAGDGWPVAGGRWHVGVGRCHVAGGGWQWSKPWHWSIS